ncbi:MAG: S41 family peptidase [Planctomycetota bacterium]|nr:MAG: S41 family peptidase [Planctomycetota bacterium]
MRNLCDKSVVYLILLSCLGAVVCPASVCAFAAHPSPVEVSEPASTESVVVKTVCDLIYQGEFDAAGELMEQTRQAPVAKSGSLDGLAQIIQEFRAISKRREEARRTTYAEKMAELEEFRDSLFSEKVAKVQVQTEPDEKTDEYDFVEIEKMVGERVILTTESDVNDANDVNDISKVLSTIAQVFEFADEQEQGKLLSEPFVQEVFQQAIEKATQFESEGKWADSYIACYSWLQAIDKDNEKYSAHAEELLEKAGIEASFQDSPCETREERFRGVEKQMFIRAIDALAFNYVNLIGYNEMATKSVRRCKLLGDVIGSSSDLREILCAEQCDEKLGAWSSALAALLEEINQTPPGMSRDKFIDYFEKVLAINATTAEIPVAVLVAQFSEASLSALDDHTVMVWPSQVVSFEKEMTKEFTGIGILIKKEKGMLTVESLLPDTPAYNSGLDAGDVIEKVDGIPTKDMSLGCAVKHITGPAGTKVMLTIRRAGEGQSRDIIITRARIVVPPIRGWQRTEDGKWLYMINERERIGYVRITNFDLRTAQELERVLDELESQGLRGLILDLRFNSGGLLSSAIEVADIFLKEGAIVSTRPRSWVSSTYAMAHKDKTHSDYPIVILINRFSASASEIVSGALADSVHGRAILVGDRTHGKGSVQGITSYPGGGAQLKYTMAYYHLPSGQRVESREAMKKQGRSDWGVAPNIEVKLTNNELRKMSEVRRDNDVLVRADHDEKAAPLKKHTVEETLASDAQLGVGVLVIKSKLIQTAFLIAKAN